MAGHCIPGIGFIDYADAEGSAVVNGRKYRWDFHRYCGPTFLRKDGAPMVRQPGEHHPVWPHFESWLNSWLKDAEDAACDDDRSGRELPQ